MEPVTAQEFTNRVTEEYDGDVSECIEQAVEDVWPAPSFRPHQKEAIVDTIEALYVKDKDVVTLSAPTGAGKSLIIYATARVLSHVVRGDSFVTTPLNALIDQIDADELIERVTTLKGKDNYSCVHPRDRGERVGDAICQRDSNFSCQFKDQPHTNDGCPYYGRKMVAKQTHIAVTNLSYLMANSMIPPEADARFEPRDLLAVDECIPKGETVVTNDGRQVEIERFKCEEPVSVDTSSGKLETDSLVNMKQTSTKECVRVHATRGSFMASHDHQMKDVDGWTDAANADRVARPLCSVSKTPKEETRAALLGYWFGDGWISSSTGVSGDVVDLERIDDDAELVYGITHTSERSEETSGSVQPVNGSRKSIDGQSNTYNYPREMAKMLKNDGLTSGDKTIKDCHIPDFDTDSETKAFIAGFFGAEGHTPSQAGDRCFNVIKATRYTTGNCVFFEEMQEALDSFGISSYIEQSEGNVRKDGTMTTRYDLVIESGRENLHRFLDQIGFEYCRRKEIEAEQIRCYLGEYLNELEQWKSDYHEIIEACDSRDWEYGAVKDEVESRGYGDRMKQYISKREEPKSITDFPAYGEWVEKYVEGDVVYEQVQQVEWIGERECYDIEVAENHNFLVGDEYLAHNCQNVEDFALQFVGFTVSPNYIPVDFDDLAEIPTEDDDMDETVEWIRNELLHAVVDKYNMLTGMDRELTTKQNNERDKLRDVKHRLNNFLQDYKEGKHWTKTHDYEYGNAKIKFEPVFVGRFLGKFLWRQCDKIILSSATVPKGTFLSDIGLSERDVERVEVPSTFPKERRPVFTDEMVGKMTSAERDETIPQMAEKIAEISDAHKGERGFIHCHSYDIMERLYERLPPDVQFRSVMQDQDRREESLEEWLQSDKQVFFSVSMTEGISLDGDKCRWQVVAKCSYPFMGDKRVSYRLNELNDWQWYSMQAAISIQQAVGRGMRSQKDRCVSYILDSSFENLFERNKDLFEPWFIEAVDCRTDLDKYGESKETFSFQ